MLFIIIRVAECRGSFYFYFIWEKNYIYFEGLMVYEE